MAIVLSSGSSNFCRLRIFLIIKLNSRFLQNPCLDLGVPHTQQIERTLPVMLLGRATGLVSLYHTLRAALPETVRRRLFSGRQHDSLSSVAVCHSCTINDLLRGRISRFSLDALVNIAASLGQHVHIELEAASL